MRFEEVKLKDITINYNKQRVPLSGKERSVMNKKYPYYGAQGIIDYVDEFIFDGRYLLVAEDGENLRSRKLNIATIASGKFWVNNHAHVIKNNDRSSFFYLYYLLSNLDVKEYLTGSVQPKLNKSNFDNIILNIPPLNVQRKIGEVLRRLDSKIELNNAIISNLEQLAQTLFKHWFVDFEFPNEEGKPYKSSGGKMVESELGMIPEGWDIGNLNYFIHETMNGDWGKAEAEKNHQFPVNIIRGADLPELRFGRDGKPPKRFILEKNFKKKSLRNGDVIVEISGGSPTQSTGRTLFVDQNILKKFDNKVVSTNFCRVLRPSIEEHGIFVHTYFAYLYNNGVFFNYENGTTGIKNLDIKSVLEGLKVVLPDETILNKFNSLVYILLNSIQKLGDENSKLEAIRDTLLPKLLSGEIELPDDMEVTDDVPIS